MFQTELRMNQINRVLVNTVAQYIRIICVIVITLYSTRIVLRELGSDDYGLYSLIGSVLAFLSFLNTTIIKSTQRYLSFYMGKDDLRYQKVVLFNSVLLNFAISVITCLIIVAIMPCVINVLLNIDPNKLYVARKLYMFMCISVFFTINVSPFSAVFVAHENIVFSSLAYITISLLRLLAAVLLFYIPEHKLLWYGFFMALISLFEFMLYYVVSKIKYIECKGLINIKLTDRCLLKSIVSFSFWNLYGTLCIIGRNQGYAFVINRFMSITANAAYGIANQVSGQITNFVYSLSNAISPIITKSQGADDTRKMALLSIESSKFSILMFSLLAIPIIFEIDFILRIWLGSYPQYTSIFIISLIIACICDCYSVGLRTGIQAVGKIKAYSLWVYTIKIASIPLSIILLICGFDKAYIFMPYIVTEFIGTIITIYFFCRYSNLNLYNVVLEAVKTISVPLLAAIGISYLIHTYMPEGFSRFFVIMFVTMLVTTIIAYFFSLNSKEKMFIKELITKHSNKR